MCNYYNSAPGHLSQRNENLCLQRLTQQVEDVQNSYLSKRGMTCLASGRKPLSPQNILSDKSVLGYLGSWVIQANNELFKTNLLSHTRFEIFQCLLIALALIPGPSLPLRPCFVSPPPPPPECGLKCPPCSPGYSPSSQRPPSSPSLADQWLLPCGVRTVMVGLSGTV